MNKGSLISGDEVVCREGDKFIVEILPEGGNLREIGSECGCLSLDNYTEDLLFKVTKNSRYDIVTVNRYKNLYGWSRRCNYQRPKTREEVTQDRIKALEESIKRLIKEREEIKYPKRPIK